MKQFITKGIVLTRTNFGEADRILTFLTPDHGKIKAIAKGVRKQKSKLAGGIELFSVSHLSFIKGRGEINTIISSRLDKHYANLAKNLERSKAAYGLIERLNKITEEQTEAEYFNLLLTAFEALNNLEQEPSLTELWFDLQLLKLSGHSPNLRTDINSQKLELNRKYNFDPDKMAFFASAHGKFSANHIKFLRLCLGLNTPRAVGRINDAARLTKSVRPLVEQALKPFL